MVGLFSKEGRLGYFFPTLAKNIRFQAKFRGFLLALCLSEYHVLTISSAMRQTLVMACGLPTYESVNREQTFLH